jgi:hypothetical protein
VTRPAVGCVALCFLVAARHVLAEGPDSPDALQIVRAYADAMIDHGRDVYGPTHSPLFASTLDRRTLRLPETEPPPISGIRSNDRTLTGGNPMLDLNLYQVLYALTKITGEPRYAAAADESLKWFFEHGQGPATGLFAWGEHLGWDFNTEAVLAGRISHEFYRPWVLWDRSFELAPQACRKFALGLWEHQIADHQQGLYSRHARYAGHGPEKGSEFPRHGGFYIATWAVAYQRTKDPALLRAIEVLLTSFEHRRNPKTGALPAASKAPDTWWPPSELSLAIDLWDGSSKVPAALASRMRAFASRTDEVYLSIPQDPGPAGKGFLWSGSTASMQPLQAKNRAMTDTWATGYGEATVAQVAMICLLRYQQVKLDRYRRLVLAASERYLVCAPNETTTLYPGAMGDAIALMMGAFRLTGQTKYLDRAEGFARRSAGTFFDGSPLPRASSKHEHYEVITRADTLAMELLDVWAARMKPGLDLGFIYSDR